MKYYSPKEESKKNRIKAFLCNNAESPLRNTTRSEGKTRVALIDRRLVTRISVTRLLEASTHAKRRSEDFIVLPFSSADELLSCYRRCGVSLILVSIGAACVGDEAVCEDIVRLKRELHELPLIILSEREESHCVLKALCCGAHSYISARLDPEVIVQALRLIQVGGIFIPPTTLVESFEETTATSEEKKSIISPTLLQGFTPRQLDVLQLLREGKPNKLIAYGLNMQESTVKVHVRQIMKKLKAINRTHAAFLATQIDEKSLKRETRDIETDNQRHPR